MIATPRGSAPARRSDAERNRARILEAARSTFTDPVLGPAAAAGTEHSMAEVARRAGVGRATLYRNFPGRRELLEALFTDEVDAVCAAALAPADGGCGAALVAWLRRFAAFLASKHMVVAELLEHTDAADPVFGSSRQRVLAAGEPLLRAAQAEGEVRTDVSLDQALDLVLAVVRLDRPEQVEAVLRVALDGLRCPGTVPGH